LPSPTEEEEGEKEEEEEEEVKEEGKKRKIHHPMKKEVKETRARILRKTKAAGASY
jgi:hypothetical protein